MYSLNVDKEFFKELYNPEFEEYLATIERESMFMTFNDLVKYLNMSNVSIREFLLWRDDFPKIRLGSKWLFPRNEVADFMQKYLEEVRAVGGDIHAMKRHKIGR